MNLHQNHQESRRRRLVNRSMAQHRELFFETIRGNTVNYTSAPVRRATRTQVTSQDFDDPRMTRALQFGIVLTMALIVYLFRAPLTQALQALFI